MLFNVLEGKGRDLIVGTPLIFSDLGLLFQNMIGKVVRTVETSVPMYCNAIASDALMADECFSTVGEWSASVGNQFDTPSKSPDTNTTTNPHHKAQTQSTPQ